MEGKGVCEVDAPFSLQLPFPVNMHDVAYVVFMIFFTEALWYSSDVATNEEAIFRFHDLIPLNAPSAFQSPTALILLSAPLCVSIPICTLIPCEPGYHLQACKAEIPIASEPIFATPAHVTARRTDERTRWATKLGFGGSGKCPRCLALLASFRACTGT